MAFKDKNPARALEDSVLGYLGITREDLAQSWEDHKAAVDAKEDEELSYAEHAESKLSALPSGDLVTKMVEVTHDTLDRLLVGTIAFENANELLLTVQAVDRVKELVIKYKNV